MRPVTLIDLSAKIRTPVSIVKADILGKWHEVLDIRFIVFSVEGIIRLAVDDLSRLLAEVLADVVVVVDLAEEADALTVLAVSGQQMFALGDGPHFGLGQMADGEAGFLELPRLQLCEEVGLVLHRVGAGAKPG